MPFNLDENVNSAGGLVHHKGGHAVGGNGDVKTVDKQGPDISLFVGLVQSGDSGEVCDLLVSVLGEDAHVGEIDAGDLVWVMGGQGELEAGIEEVGRRGLEVEVEDGCVLEDESGCSGMGETDDEQDRYDHQIEGDYHD